MKSQFRIGDSVFDDLTGEETTVVDVWEDPDGNLSVQVDSDYLDGLRHPWELTPVEGLNENEE